MYDALLTMYGEKVEETDELRMDVADLKQMYRQLLQEHMDSKPSSRTDREKQSSQQQQSQSVLGATKPSQQLQAAAELSGSGPGTGSRSQARGASAASGSNKATGSNTALSKSFADWELEGWQTIDFDEK